MISGIDRKRMFSLLLAATMCLSLYSAGVCAVGRQTSPTASVTAQAAEVHIQVGSTEVQSVETATISVQISCDSPIAGLALEFTLPEGAELTDMEKGSVLKSGLFTREKQAFSWFTTQNTYLNGELLRLTVKAPVAAGSYAVSVGIKNNKPSNVTNQSGAAVSTEFTDGTLVVKREQSTNSDPTPGTDPTTGTEPTPGTDGTLNTQ